MASDFSCVLLTYKGKILLSSPDLPIASLKPQSWCLISVKQPHELSPEQTIQKKIKYTTKLDLKNINLLSPSLHKNHGEYFYHGQLSDNDVNSIERREGERLEFFTLVEIEKLLLTEATQVILEEHKNAIAQLFPRE